MEMIQIFLDGKDIHMGNASMMYGVPYEEIKQAKQTDKLVKQGDLPPEAMTSRVHDLLRMRADAKNIGFGLNYGMGAKKLAGRLGCSVAEAQAKINIYKATYPAVTDFYAEAIQETEDTGYAFTILGRRRNLPSILSNNKYERLQAERKAVNTPIQGSAADVCKLAQILCDKSGMDDRLGCMMLLQIHDELVFECPDETAEEARKEIKSWMENSLPTDLDVPLTVDIGIGPSWGHAK
jgi:DNA polymerase-1